MNHRVVLTDATDGMRLLWPKTSAPNDRVDTGRGCCHGDHNQRVKYLHTGCALSRSVRPIAPVRQICVDVFRHTREEVV